MKYFSKISWSMLLGGVFILFGCSSGGGGGGGGMAYTGVTTPAAISESNAVDMGTASAEAAGKTVNDGEANTVNPFGISISDGTSSKVRRQVDDIVKRIVSDLSQNQQSVSAAGVIYTADDLNNLASQDLGQTVNWFCGGSIDGPSNLNATSGTITFNNLCFDVPEIGANQVFLNGKVIFVYTESGDNWTETNTYVDFTVTMNGETYTLSGTETCSGNYSTFEESCADLYTGTDGNTYQIADASYYGDGVGGYYVNATFYHPEYGYVQISTTSAVTFNCSNGFPDSGTISFMGTGGSSGTITFNNDCSTYTVTYDDGAGNSGTIDGTW